MATVRVGELVRLDGVALGYDGEVALRDVNLQISPGELIGIVGPSGCGKTNPAALVYWARTEVYAGDSSVADNTRVGYVPQVETVDWNFPITVEQVALLGSWRTRRWLPWTSRAERSRARVVLSQLGIADLAGPADSRHSPEENNNGHSWRERWSAHPICCCSMSQRPASISRRGTKSCISWLR